MNSFVVLRPLSLRCSGLLSEHNSNDHPRVMAQRAHQADPLDAFRLAFAVRHAEHIQPRGSARMYQIERMECQSIVRLHRPQERQHRRERLVRRFLDCPPGMSSTMGVSSSPGAQEPHGAPLDRFVLLICRLRLGRWRERPRVVPDNPDLVVVAEFGVEVGELPRAAYAPRDTLDSTARYDGLEARQRENVDAEAEDHAWQLISCDIERDETMEVVDARCRLNSPCCTAPSRSSGNLAQGDSTSSDLSTVMYGWEGDRQASINSRSSGEEMKHIEC